MKNLIIFQQLLILLFFCLLIKIKATCQNSVSYPIKNKASSEVHFTSFVVKTGNAPTTTVTAPAPWVATRERVQGFWKIAGGSLPPGGTLVVTVSNSTGNARVQAVYADYRDSKGNLRWGQVCSDPISATVVFGGESGCSYLNYDIPAYEYGYFYQMWNKPDFIDQVKTAKIFVGTSNMPYNFTVLSNSFEIRPVHGFDLQDMEVWSAVPENTSYEFQHYMEEIDALGISGVDMEWRFNPNDGYAIMTFFPQNPEKGMGAGQTGSIVAYTSPFAPGFLIEEPNVEVVFIGPFNCPKDYILAPSGGITQTFSLDISTSSGDYFSNNQGSLSWTLGETTIETISDSTFVLTQGFQQILDTLSVIINNKELLQDLKIAIFPNPYKNKVWIESKSKTTSFLHLKLLSGDGKEIMNQNIKLSAGSSTSLELSHLPVGIYLLSLLDKTTQQPLFFRIQKNH